MPAVRDGWSQAGRMADFVQTVEGENIDAHAEAQEQESQVDGVFSAEDATTVASHICTKGPKFRAIRDYPRFIASVTSSTVGRPEREPRLRHASPAAALAKAGRAPAASP